MNTNGCIRDEKAGLLTIRDPQILLADGRYYLTGTQPPYWNGPNDGVHIWSSADLTDWKDEGLVISRKKTDENAWYRDRFWAPELADGKNGFYYLTFNCRNDLTGFPHACGIARSRKPEGPYEIMSESQPLSRSHSNPDGKDYNSDTANDASIFIDDDGKAYVTYTRHTYLVTYELDLDSCALVGDEMLVLETGADAQWDHIGVEGSFIVKRHGIYFYWYSSWTRGYESGIATSDSIKGPWKKCPLNPILTNNDSLPYRNPGHNSAFRDKDGKDYIVFHATDNEIQTEQMYIREVEYCSDGSVIIK